MSSPVEPRIYRGLKDVYFERSPCTLIDGKAGELRYRGYPIHDLAQHSTFEETAYLLLHGELPKSAELQLFETQLKERASCLNRFSRSSKQCKMRTQWRCCEPQFRRWLRSIRKPQTILASRQSPRACD